MRSLGFFCAMLLVAADAVAAEPSEGARAAAREAYEAGVAATESGDLPRAARSFARADELAPNVTALESALEAALRAEDAALGMELVERAARRPDAAGLPAVALARGRFASRAGRAAVVCTEPCSVSVDGAAVPNKALWLALGPHRFRADGGAQPVERTVDVRAGTTNEVDLRGAVATPPDPAGGVAPPLPADSSESDRGLVHSPALFFVGAGATVILGGLAIWSFADTGGIHSDFEAKSAAYDGSPGARRELEALAADGESAGTRSWIFVGAGAATAVGTGLLGALVTDWGGPGEPTTGWVIGPLGAAATTRF